MLKLGFEPKKIFTFSKNALLPLLVISVFLIYFFSVSEFSESVYHSMHALFLIISAIAILVALIGKIPSIVMSVSIIYISYLVINSMRYAYGEDYMFSAGYNIWSILLLPNLLLAYIMFPNHKPYKYWSMFYIFLFIQTALIEKLQIQSIDADSSYFYHHIGMLNYPAVCISVICLLILFIRQIIKGRVLCAAALFTSLATFIGVLYSDNLFAFSLFSLSAVLIELVSALYYIHYILYKDEDLDVPNVRSFFKEADKKYPLKYSIALMYIDEYERLLKRFGPTKALILKKMFLARIRKAKPNVLIYNYKADALILAFMNINAAECFDYAEEIRRVLAKSIFVFNENNHLQLTVSQCVSEKKRSDADSAAVLERAEDNLQKACKFTRNITIKA